jgi:hypothetical protein
VETAATNDGAGADGSTIGGNASGSEVRVTTELLASPTFWWAFIGGGLVGLVLVTPAYGLGYAKGRIEQWRDMRKALLEEHERRAQEARQAAATQRRVRVVARLPPDPDDDPEKLVHELADELRSPCPCSACVGGRPWPSAHRVLDRSEPN